MRLLYFGILQIFFSVSLNAQEVSVNAVEAYPYDTTLKGGYTISFQVDDSLQYLYLKHSGKTIAEVAATTKGHPYKNLGYVGADFKEHFVLVHSYGSGNPHYIEIIKKANGKNVVGDIVVWIDANEEKELVLYSDHDVPRKGSKMTLYNVTTGKKQFFDFPSDIFDGPQVLNRIQVSKWTDKLLVIKYETQKGFKNKIVQPLTLHLQTHGFRTTPKPYIFNPQQKASKAEANKCHAFVNALDVDSIWNSHLN